MMERGGNSTVERILATRGHVRPPPEGYVAFRDSGGHPQMGFSLHRRNGDIDGFMYHNIDNISVRSRAGEDFLSFTHRGKAVTLKGVGLEALYQSLMAHTLMVATESPDRAAIGGADCRIDRVLVTVLSDTQKAAEAAAITPRGDA